MGIFYSTNPDDFRAVDGVVIAEQEQPQPARIIGDRLVKLVAAFPWGPKKQVIEVRRPADLKPLLGEFDAPETYGGWQALDGKTYGRMLIVPVEADDAVKASRTLADGAAADQYSITGKHTGAPGNQIETKHTDNGDDTFMLEVRWGNYYMAYDGLELTAESLATVDDKYVDLALVGDGATVPDSDADWVALEDGDDGTLSDTNYTGDLNSVEGLELLKQKSSGGFVISGGYTSAAWLGALSDYCDEHRAQAAAQADAGDDFDTNLQAAQGENDDRLILCLHRVKQLVSNTETTVDLAPFLASIWSQIPAHYSLADADNDEFLDSIIGYADGVVIGRAERIDANQAGSVVLEQNEDPTGNTTWKVASAVATDGTLITTRRMKDLVGTNVGYAALPFANKPAMAEFKEDGLKAMGDVLDEMKAVGKPAQQRLISEYFATILSSDAAEVQYQIKVQLHGEIRFQIINLTVGENVIIEEAGTVLPDAA